MCLFKRYLIFRESNDEEFTTSPACLLLYLIISLLKIGLMSILLYINDDVLHKFCVKKTGVFYVCFFQWCSMRIMRMGGFECRKMGDCYEQLEHV